MEYSGDDIMAGVCKPNIKDLCNEVQYKLIGSKSHEYSLSSYSVIEIKDAVKYLFDEKIEGNVMSYRDNDDYVEIEILHACNIWSYSNNNYNNTIKIFRQTNGKYLEVSSLYKQNYSEKYKWTKIIENLDKGTYKLMSTGGGEVRYNEWYLECINNKKYLIKQKDTYYTIKSSYYNENKLDTTLVILDDNTFDINKAIDNLNDICSGKIPNENYNIIKIVE